MSWRGLSRRAIPFVVVAIGGFLIAYLIVALFVFPSKLISRDARVPNVMGSTFNTASQRLVDAGFSTKKGEVRYHAVAEEGTVLGQNPVPGAVEPRGTRVVLDVSLGQRQAVVPNVVAMTRSQAEIALENAGLGLGQIAEESSQQPRGKVLASLPTPGGRVPIGAAIDLTVSRGPSTIEVPDVVGQSYQQARNMIGQLGLSVGRISVDTLSAMQPNTVVTQSPAAGRSVVPGTEVHLTISGTPSP